jgi:hypothetical protein
MNKSEFKNIIKECISQVIIENLGEDSNNPLYVEYLKPMRDENPFMMNGEKFEYCWAKYPNGKTDIGVYAYRGDVCYGYNAFRKRYNPPENTTQKKNLKTERSGWAMKSSDSTEYSLQSLGRGISHTVSFN